VVCQCSHRTNGPVLTLAPFRCQLPQPNCQRSIPLTRRALGPLFSSDPQPLRPTAKQSLGQSPESYRQPFRASTALGRSLGDFFSKNRDLPDRHPVSAGRYPTDERNKAPPHQSNACCRRRFVLGISVVYRIPVQRVQRPTPKNRNRPLLTRPHVAPSIVCAPKKWPLCPSRSTRLPPIRPIISKGLELDGAADRLPCPPPPQPRFAVHSPESASAGGNPSSPR
jgi:hypothetical protein